MRIGICERGWSRPGASTHQTIEELLQTAVEVEALGFDKLWLSEHHTAEYAWALPDVLVAAVGRAVPRITVGIGGVLMSSRNPYRTALDLSLLDAALPGRFEVGVAAGPADLVATLLRCLGFAVDGDESPSPDRDALAPTPPATGFLPWLLGSSVESTLVAARWGLPFGCIDSPIAPAVVERYRGEFRPSPWLAEPRVLVNIIGVPGDDERASIGDRFFRVIDSVEPDEIVYTHFSADAQSRARTYRAVAEQVLGRRPAAAGSTAA